VTVVDTPPPVGIAERLDVRTRVRVPLRLDGDHAVTAEVFTFTGLADGKEHLALGLGDFTGATTPLVRAHSECLTGDVFGSARCDCGPQLREAVGRIAERGGFLLYLRQEGRGIGLYAKLDAYALQDTGLDTYAANRALGRADDERDYTAAAQMLTALGVDRIDLLTNNPDKARQLRGLGIDVASVVPTGVHASADNLRYLQAKVAHTGHTIALPAAGRADPLGRGAIPKARRKPKDDTRWPMPGQRRVG
jgi:GTP cyclohydrolase II